MLFRQVGRTVYVEDLGSTNGTKVNGIAATNQVVHHLDLIEIGRHKVHFFDEDMLAGRVGRLETTVQTDYERTMMADHVAIGRSRPLRPEGTCSSTAPWRFPALWGRRRRPCSTGAATARPRAQGGRRGYPGQIVTLNRANTMIGVAGGRHRPRDPAGRSFFIARLSGNRAPRLNRKELAPGTHPIARRTRSMWEDGASRSSKPERRRQKWQSNRGLATRPRPPTFWSRSPHRSTNGWRSPRTSWRAARRCCARPRTS
jgi:hypothetical protein